MYSFKIFLYIQKEAKEKMIDLDKLNPDWAFAAAHGQASKVGLVSNKKDGSKLTSKTAICRCCLNVIYKDPAPMCSNSKDLEVIGFGFPLYFVFLKNCIILLLLSIFSYSGLSLYWALSHNYNWCHPEFTDHHRLLESSSEAECETFMVDMSRVEKHVQLEEQILRIISFIMHLGFLIYMRDKIMKLEAYYDERSTTLTDYSIIIKNIPKQKKLQAKLREFFRNQFQSAHQIQQITLLPEYENIKILKREKLKLINELRQHYSSQDDDSIEGEHLKHEIQQIELQIQKQAQKMSDLAKEDLMECQRAILIFSTDEEKQKIIQQFSKIDLAKKGPYFGVGSEQITLKEAPQPREILWDNINVSNSNKILYKLVGWGLSILLLFLVTLIFYFIMEKKALALIEAIEGLHKHPHDKKYESKLNQAIALGYIMLILIVLFNKLIMSILFHKFTDLQRNDTSSKYQFSFGLKYCLGLFFTTALMTLAVQAIRFQNYYSHLYGVIDEETIMFFLNALFVPLFWLVNPFQLFRLIERKLNRGKRELTQREANKLMEDSEYEIGKRYAEIIETMWFTFLYSTIIPVGTILSCVGLVFYYWVDKYNLLRRSSLTNSIQGRLVRFSMNLLDFTLFMKPFGQILFDHQMRGQVTIWSIVMLLIGLLYLVIPINWVITQINSEKFNLEEKSYQTVKSGFKDTYHSLHPTYIVANKINISQKFKKNGIKFDNTQQMKTQSNLGTQIDLAVNKTQSNVL